MRTTWSHKNTIYEIDVSHRVRNTPRRRRWSDVEVEIFVREYVQPNICLSQGRELSAFFSSKFLPRLDGSPSTSKTVGIVNQMLDNLHFPEEAHGVVIKELTMEYNRVAKMVRNPADMERVVFRVEVKRFWPRRVAAADEPTEETSSDEEEEEAGELSPRY